MSKAYQLVDDYYSLNDQERFQAIELLAESKTNDAARELIRIYDQCEWRETKIQIIQALAHFNFQRALVFLFQVALNTQDLPLAEMAVQSIAQVKLPLASRFLTNNYLQGPSHLKPCIALAFAHRCDPSVAQQMVTDLEKAIRDQQIYLAKNLIFTLGEIKYAAATAILLKIAAEPNMTDLSLGSIVSLGKILRQTDPLLPLSHLFKKDIFQKQIFENAIKQIQYRSQWKLEDYLNKYFGATAVHPAITLEISTFDFKHVENYFKNVSSDFLKQLQIISRFSPETLVNWLQNQPVESLQLYIPEILQTLSHFKSNIVTTAFKKLNIDPHSVVWMDAVALTSDEADQSFKDLIHSLSENSTTEKINIINSLSLFLYVQSYNSKKTNDCRKWVEKQFDIENDPSVLARWIRLCADHQFESAYLTAWCEKNWNRGELIKSLLYYAELCPKPEFVDTIIHSLDQIQDPDLIQNVIKSLSSQKISNLSNSTIEKWLLNKVIKIENPEVIASVLHFLSCHPMNGLKNYVTQKLQSKNPEILIQAIITAKQYPNESTFPDLLAVHLKHSSKSIQGRAFDTLLTSQELRAKRISIDHFSQNSQNPEIVGKFLRSFTPPETTADYFIKSLQDFAIKNPESEFQEELQHLLDLIQTKNQQSQKNWTPPKAEDIIRIDERLKAEIPYYEMMDETAKTSLRSAEVPFHHPEIFDQYIDKSAIILGYAKAIDLVLEKHFAKKQLFPVLEKKLFDFQNIIHACHLNEEYPVAERVLNQLSLDKYFSAQSLPVHKMSLIAKSILNTKIMNDHFKILDGLRSWAVIFLMFCRKTTSVPKPAVSLNIEESQLIQIAKKLMWLQDVRNPVAHRQTIVDFAMIEQARKESLAILKSLNFLFK